MYKCHACGKQFQSGERVSPLELWNEYLDEKRTYKELAKTHSTSVSTIRRVLYSEPPQFSPFLPHEAVVIIDTTYFGRKWGVMIFIDARTNRVLNRKFVKNETNALYHEGLQEIKRQGTRIVAVVCDGHTGLLESIITCPVQMCQFHQLQIVRRLLTSSPHLLAAKELRKICLEMKSHDEESFSQILTQWHDKWKHFLKERTTYKSGKSGYTHKRLCGAYGSLQHHLHWLFAYKNFPELQIPNTTNLLEGLNSEMKRRLASHNGLTKDRKQMFIKGFLKTWKSNPNISKKVSR